MPDSAFADTLSTVAAGRAAAVAELRGLADRLGRLALRDVAEVLVLSSPCSTTSAARPRSRSSARPADHASRRDRLAPRTTSNTRCRRRRSPVSGPIDWRQSD
jgi:hypothetical protein